MVVFDTIEISVVRITSMGIPIHSTKPSIYRDKGVPVMVTMSQSVKERAIVAAKSEERTLSSYVNHVVSKAVRDVKP